MNLYLIRHGEAVPAGGTIIHDSERVLTDRGRDDAELVGSMLSRIHPSITLILTSPLVRAVETGQIIAAALQSKPAVRRADSLAPGFRHGILLNELTALKEENIIAVGHQPDMSNFIAYLIAESSAGVAMATCSVAFLEVSHDSTEHHARLRWLVTPELIRHFHTMLKESE